jgi:hypothetical protein
MDVSHFDCSAGPTPNTDVSGIGVRVSFYLQAIFLCKFAQCYDTVETIHGTENIRVSSLICSFSQCRRGLRCTLNSHRHQRGHFNCHTFSRLQIKTGAHPLRVCYTKACRYLFSRSNTFIRSGLVVCYLLLFSWAAIFHAVLRYNRFVHIDPIVKLAAIVQTYFVAGTCIAILYATPWFGSNAECNAQRKFVFFGTFSAVGKGRYIGLGLTIMLLVVFTVSIGFDYARKKECEQPIQHSRGPKQQHQSLPSIDSLNQIPLQPISMVPLRTSPTVNLQSTAMVPLHTSCTVTFPTPAVYSHQDNFDLPEELLKYETNLDGYIVVRLIVIIAISALMIAHTEELRHYNHPSSEDSSWGFGQVSFYC